MNWNTFHQTPLNPTSHVLPGHHPSQVERRHPSPNSGRKQMVKKRRRPVNPQSISIAVTLKC